MDAILDRLRALGRRQLALHGQGGEPGVAVGGDHRDAGQGLVISLIGLLGRRFGKEVSAGVRKLFQLFISRIIVS